MSTVKGIARFRIHAGKTEEFKRLTAKCVRLAREKDTGTLRYEVFLNADETEAVVFEEYTSSEASIQHFWNMGENSAAIFAIVDAEGEMLGDPSPTLRKAVEEHDVRLFSPFLAL